MNEERIEPPARFVSPALECGFLLIPVVSVYSANRLVALRNLSLAAKYDQRTTHQIGISVARREADYMIDWCYASCRWSHKPAIEALLRESYPFRPTTECVLPRYNFFTDGLRQSGLLRSES